MTANTSRTESARDRREDRRSTETVTAVAPQRPQMWHSLMLAAVVLISTSVALGWTNGVADGHLVDTDAYSWLNRVVELRDDGQWFDDTVHRVNPPDGLRQHWSRPFDVLLLSGAMAGAPVLGFTTALFGWAVVLPVLLGVATLVVLWWGFSDLLDDAGRDALALIFGLQLTIVMGFMAGRSDHQALMGPITLGVVAVCRRAFGRAGTDRTAAIAGALSGFALWVGMEAALLVGGLVLAIGIQWIVRGGAELTRLRTYALALAASSTAALLAENGIGGAFQTQLDELSVVLTAAALVLAAGAAILDRMHDRWTSPVRRAVPLAIVGVTCLAALVAAFPAILDGPLGSVDGTYASTRLRHIGEIQPPVGPTLRETINLAVPGLSLLPLVGLYLWGVRHRLSRLLTDGLHLLLVPACVYLVLAVGQIRWLFLLNLLLVVPAALGAQRLMHAVMPSADRVRPGMLGVVAIAALWWLPFFVWSVPELAGECDLDDAVTALERADDEMTVMAFTDHGPELLFRTTHNVLSIPNHRYQPGYTATFRAMSSTSPEASHEIVARNGVDLVLVCANGAETTFYGGDPASFHARLAAGDAPQWLKPLPVPTTGEAPFKLYRVTR